MIWLYLLLYAGRPVLLLIRGGKVELRKGKMSPPLLAGVRDVVEVSGVESGAVFRNFDGRWGFSFGMPPEIQQRLRNVLTAR